jgi:hypothetical protein
MKWVWKSQKKFQCQHHWIDLFITPPILAEWTVQKIQQAGSSQVLRPPQQPNQMTKKCSLLSHSYSTENSTAPLLCVCVCVFVHRQDKFSFPTTGAPATCSQSALSNWRERRKLYANESARTRHTQTERDYCFASNGNCGEPIRPVYFQLIAVRAPVALRGMQPARRRGGAGLPSRVACEHLPLMPPANLCSDCQR